jgi:hypothetical protein
VNPADSSIWLTVRNCPEGFQYQSLCYARIGPGGGKIEYESLAVTDSETGVKISLDAFQRTGISFSGKNRLLVFDINGEADYFFDVDLGAMAAKKLTFKQPDGKTILPHALQWGPDGESVMMIYDGSVWVKIPGVDQPFPIAVGFFVYNPAVWVP